MFMRIFSGRGREILGRTIAEKILANHSGQPARAGDIVLADLDFIMGQDGTSPLAIDVLRQMGGVKVAEPSKAALVIDHNAPSPSEGFRHCRHDAWFFPEMSVQIYDVGEGVCHQLVPEQGHVVPGDLVIGADSILYLRRFECLCYWCGFYGLRQRLIPANVVPRAADNARAAMAPWQGVQPRTWCYSWSVRSAPMAPLTWPWSLPEKPSAN